MAAESDGRFDGDGVEDGDADSGGGFLRVPVNMLVPSLELFA